MITYGSRSGTSAAGRPGQALTGWAASTIGQQTTVSQRRKGGATKAVYASAPQTLSRSGRDTFALELLSGEARLLLLTQAAHEGNAVVVGMALRAEHGCTARRADV